MSETAMAGEIEATIAELRNVLTDWNGADIPDAELPRIDVLCGTLRRAADALARLTAELAERSKEVLAAQGQAEGNHQRALAAEVELARVEKERAEFRDSWLKAEIEAYDLKYAAAGGEDVPGSAHVVTAADVDRWRKEAEARALTAEAALAKAVETEREACARIVEGHQVTSTSEGNVLSKRGDGNREALAYATAIRARSNGESP